MIRVKIYSGDLNHDICSIWRAKFQYDGDFENIKIDFSDSNIFDINVDKNYDIIIFIRFNFGYEYLKKLQDEGVKVIFDYDDSLPLVNEPDVLISHMNDALKVIKECDMISTTNERLKIFFQYNSHNQNIEVLPNIINPKFISQNKKDNGDKIILGWYGTWSHYYNLIEIKDTVLKILDEYENVYLNLYSDIEQIFGLFEHPKTNKINYIMNFEEFQERLGDIDINLAPINENYVNLHKSDIRLTLVGYKGIPSVASNFGSYKDLGKENVILCENNSDWYNGIKSLIENIELRKNIGKNIQTFINENLMFESTKNKKKELFEKLHKKNFTLVQLGSNKGNDELTKFIKENHVSFKKAIFVEANPFHIEELKKCYENYENVIVENIAIKPTVESEDKLKIYYHTHDNPHYEVASCSIDHVAKHHNYDYDNISNFEIDAITLEQLLDKHNITKIDWLLIDVEGIDAEIVENFNWNKYDIRKVDVEHIHFGEKWHYIFEMFYSMGFKHILANDVRYDAGFEKIN